MPAVPPSPDLFGIVQQNPDTSWQSLEKLVTFDDLAGLVQNDTGDIDMSWQGKADADLTWDDRKNKNKWLASQNSENEQSKANAQSAIDRQQKDFDSVYGPAEPPPKPSKPKVKPAFVWHIMYALFALFAVMLVGYLSKQNMADKDADAKDEIDIEEKAPPPPSGPSSQGRGAAGGRDMDEEKFRQLSKLIGSFESKPATYNFHFKDSASAASTAQASALATMSTYAMKPKKGAPRQDGQSYPRQFQNYR